VIVRQTADALRIVVSPDVFGGITVPVSIDAREIRQRAFRTGNELREALLASALITVEGVVIGQPL
jgi:hypothetical protein